MPQQIGYHRILTIPVANVHVGDVLVVDQLESGLKLQGAPKHLLVIDFRIDDGYADIKFNWPEFNMKNVPLWRTVDMNATATYLGGPYDA